MKLLVRLFSLLSGAVLALGMSSCDDSDDVVDQTAPTVELHEPHSGDEASAGGAIEFEAHFTDDVELGTYNIDIHDDFDGHDHGRIAQRNEDPSLDKWMYSQSFDIPSGLQSYEAMLEDDIQVASNAMAGPYHFIVQAIDRAGNSTSYQDGSTVEVAVHITNDSQSKVEITNLVEGEFEIEVGLRFMGEGTISDPTTGNFAGMEEIEIMLAEDHEGVHDHDHGRTASEDPLIDFHIEGDEIEQYMVDGVVPLNPIFTEIDFTLSQTELEELQAEEVDHLVLTITVIDNQGNITISETPVHIHTD